MSATLNLVRARHYVLAVDDERAIGNSIIVTLREPYCFRADPGCGVRGFDNASEAERGTRTNEIYLRGLLTPFCTQTKRAMTNTTNPAQTLAQRQAAWRQRQRAAGLKELRQLWADPADHDAIRAYAAKPAVKRAKGTR